MTLTLDFQGQILKMQYLRNGTKGMWVDKMLDSYCDWTLTSPMILTLDFQGQFFK